MNAVDAKDLIKTYRTPVRQPGLRAAFASLGRRQYRDIEAVAGVSFSIEPGEIVGFLGPNGAGKTTTLKMQMGSWTTYYCNRSPACFSLVWEPVNHLPFRRRCLVSSSSL